MVRLAGAGHRDQAITIDGSDGRFFPFGRPPLPQRSDEYARSRTQLKRRHDQTDLIPFDLQLPPRDTRIRGIAQASLFPLIRYFSFQKIQVKQENATS